MSIRFAFVVVWGLLGGSSAFALTVGANLNLSQSPAHNSEPAIAVDPANANRVFAVSDLESNGLFVSVSSDGGRSWTGRTAADGSDNLAIGRFNPSVAFDSFGNLYLAYIVSDFTSIALALSTDGGATFTPVRFFGGNVFQPTLAAGLGTIWINYTTSSGVVASGAAVNGLGSIGAFSTPQLAPDSINCAFSDIAIGPNGQVLVTYQNNLSGDDGSAIFVNLDPDGLGPAPFGPQIQVTNTNVGGSEFLPAQINRGIDAAAGLAWDCSGKDHNGRVYFVYTDERPDESDNFDIYLRFSDNNGMSWSAPRRVNDDIGTTSQFLPHIAIDQSTGNVAVCWYDCREDSGAGPGDTNGSPNDDAKLYFAVSINGGVLFEANVRVARGGSNAEGTNTNTEFGGYSGLAYQNGVAIAAWCDNSNSTGDNPAGTLIAMDLYTARITPILEPVLILESAELDLACGCGNQDDVIDQRECNELIIKLKNDGTKIAQGITAYLATKIPEVTISQPVSTYADIQPGADAINGEAFRFSTSASIVPGTIIQFELTVSQNGGETLKYGFKMRAGKLEPAVRFNNNTPLPIPDDATVSSAISVSGIQGSIGKVTVSLYAQHSYDGDLIIELISPDNTSVFLLRGDANGFDLGTGPGDSQRMIFDSDSTLVIAGTISPYVGPYKPHGDLYDFAGKTGAGMNGTWTLRITDTFQVDDGVLNTWSLFVQPLSISDGGGECARPTAVADTFSTPYGSLLTVTAAQGVLANDTTDNINDPLRATLSSAPVKGTLQLNPNGSFTYQPNFGATGTDSFQYLAIGENAAQATATITIVGQNTPPVAQPASASAISGVPVTGQVSATDANSDTLTYTLKNSPQHGTVQLNSANGNFTYTPDLSYSGADTFTYVANDGLADSNTATVSITIVPPNEAPVAFNSTYYFLEDRSLTGAAIAYDFEQSVLTFSVVIQPTLGTLAFNPETGEFTYVPQPNINGNDYFSFQVNDGRDNSNVATVDLNIEAVNDVAEITSAASATPANPRIGQAVTFSAHATDSDDATLTYAWDFGDGRTAFGESVSIVYNTPGVYLATLSISDGHGGVLLSIVRVTVTASEVLATKMAVKLDFAKPNADSISLSGALELDGTFAGVVTFNIGGVVKAISVDASGKSPKGNDVLVLSAPKGGLRKFAVKFSKGSFAGRLLDEQFTNENVKSRKTAVLITITTDGAAFQKLQPQLYSAVQGKSGSSK